MAKVVIVIEDTPDGVRIQQQGVPCSTCRAARPLTPAELTGFTACTFVDQYMKFGYGKQLHLTEQHTH